MPTDIPFAAVRELAESAYGSVEELYRYLHAHPELSFREENTARRLAQELQESGFDVIPGVGGHGVVGVLRNGLGGTVLVRTDMDGLPVEERTGLPYRSRVRLMDDFGNEVSVMHACGHDLHMAVFIGAGRLLARLKECWGGTLVFVAQPAEERSEGAKAMISDGLFDRFPRPDCCLALHVSPSLPAGVIGWSEGYSWASVDMLDITIPGVGGHGAYPHMTRDPIVTAAQAVLAFQTIISRDVDPNEPAVLTVGAIQGGSTYNVIPEEVRIKVTVRSYAAAVRDNILRRVEQILAHLSGAADLPADRQPSVTVTHSQPAVYNDPALTRRLVQVFSQAFGGDRVVMLKPEMGGEDFGFFGMVEPRIPICIFRLGAVDPGLIAQGRSSHQTPPSLHSSTFAPLPTPTITTGVEAMTLAVLDCLRGAYPATRKLQAGRSGRPKDSPKTTGECQEN